MWLIIFLLFNISCATNNSLKNKKGSYLETVKLNFDAGEEAFIKKDFDKAIGYYQFVKSKYPFSQYAHLSDLKIADVKFAQKKWIDAALAYEVFIRLHPRHEQVNYAYYQVGLCYFNAVPQNSFFYPPATTKDQTFTKKALETLQLFIEKEPNSPKTQEVKDKINLLYSYLADHEKHSAHYYLKIKKYASAADQYEQIFDLYPSTTQAPECLYLAAKIYEEKLNDQTKASEIYDKLITYYEEGKYVDLAKKALENLNRGN